jgi:DNA-binding XRE family transcriptional regulator
MKLADWIEQEGYRKQKIAEKLGISSTAIYSILSGTYLPGLETAVAIERLTKGKVRCEDWLIEKPKNEKQESSKVNPDHQTNEPKLKVMQESFA